MFVDKEGKFIILRQVNSMVLLPGILYQKTLQLLYNKEYGRICKISTT